jgi:large subunit ribosomal protein L4
MLRGGGVAFGPKPRDFSTKLPRKIIQMGMRVALSSKVQENNLGVMKSMDWPSGKTRHLSQKIDSLGLRNTLFVTGEASATLQRAIQNIPLVKLTTSKQVNVYEMLKWPRVILDAKAVDFFEQTLGKITDKEGPVAV